MLKNADMKSEHKSTGGKERYAMSRLQEMGLCISIQPEHTQIATLFQEASSIFFYFFFYFVCVLIIA